MLTIKLFLLSIIMLFSYAHVLKAEMLPVGSYQKTCAAISVSKDQLSATCETLSGKTRKTTLDHLAACLNSISQDGDIGNIDGNLVCLPDLPKVDPQLTFPEPEITVNQWVYNGELDSIYQHAWGVWAALTSNAGSVDGVPVRAFETWNTLSNMLYQMGLTSAETSVQQVPSRVQNFKLDLSIPNQFRNMANFKTNLKQTGVTDSEGNGDTRIFVSVAYNPPAAQHAINNQLFSQKVLNTFLKDGYKEIPNFPVNAITIKPVYKIISKNVAGGVYKFPAWPGTPSPAITFPEEKWGSCVYVDIKGSGEGGHSIDPDCNKQSKENTFYLSNFIHQKISAENAQYLETQLNIKVSEGDYAILVGMHVTTRETKRWTWQTYWWSANPSEPYSPSSKAIANKRPLKYLDKAAQHYAMSVAYQMVSPAQPITDGVNRGESLIAYNPYLEAGFDPGVFQVVRKINGTIENKYGVQTNCMTCHNLALYDPKTNYSINDGANREKPYGTDFYMSIDDAIFNNTLRLDFAWSILGAMKLDDKGRQP